MPGAVLTAAIWLFFSAALLYWPTYTVFVALNARLMPALAWPAGSPFLARSALRRGEPVWRGTHYPLSELRKGKRFRAF